MIRAATVNDIHAIARLAIAAKMFSDGDEVFLHTMMEEYFSANQALGHGCVIDEENGEQHGVAYYTPVKATDRVWELLMIAVHPDFQGRGQGAALMSQVESTLREQGQRMIIVQTSGQPSYALTRLFYTKLGYEQEARVRDYYTAGEDMILFRKLLEAVK
jgi:ribosomal protein S18 acetylase RimI-like enzyme